MNWKFQKEERAPKNNVLFWAETKNNGTILCYGNEYGYFSNENKNGVIPIRWAYLINPIQYEEEINSLKVSIAARDYTIQRFEKAMILDSIAFANWITRHATEADECDKWYRVDISDGKTITDFDEIITTDVLYDIYRKTL